MAGMEIKRRYECGACNSIHDYHSAAKECCAPDVYDVYECPVCKYAHESEKDARVCIVRHALAEDARGVDHCPNCLREAETAQAVVEVAVAGHCSTCDPIYTAEQNLQILDAMNPK